MGTVAVTLLKNATHRFPMRQLLHLKSHKACLFNQNDFCQNSERTILSKRVYFMSHFKKWIQS
jgi:hypothetical protein